MGRDSESNEKIGKDMGILDIGILGSIG